MVDREYIVELINEYERMVYGAGISDIKRWMRKAYKVLKEVVEYV